MRDALPLALDVGAVAADAQLDAVADLDRVDGAGVDLAQVAHQLFQALVAVIAEVEALQPGRALLVAGRDPVEIVLHQGRELVVDEAAEVLFEQVRDGERDERRHERLPLLVHVAALEDRPEDRRVGRRAADPALLERPHERRLREACGRDGRVRLGLEPLRRQLVALGERRQAALLLVLRDGLVAALLVGEHEASEGDHGAGGAELGIPAVVRLAAHAHRDGLAARIGHLGGDGAFPDQVVERGLVALHLAAHVVGQAEAVPGGPDRLVGLLRVLHLAGVVARGVGDRLGAVEGAGLVARGRDGALRERRRVGAHVGDEAVLVEPLGDAHRVLRREAELAARLLLQRRGHERRRRTTRVRLPLHGAHRERDALERLGEAAGVLLLELDGVRGDERAVACEVAPLRHLLAVDRGQPSVELAGVERGDDVPVLGGAELDPLALALDHEPRRDRLHAAGGEALHHLAPEDGGDLVAIEAVQNAARLLRIDEPVVDVARLPERPLDRLLRDLVEDHPAHGDLRLQHLAQVPGDRLALAIFVRREQELVGVRELRPQIRDDGLLLRIDDVERLEVLIDVDAEPGPRLLLVLGRHLCGAVREVADMADRRLDHVVLPEVPGDRLGLRR